jgi:hypothetical protein
MAFNANSDRSSEVFTEVKFFGEFRTDGFPWTSQSRLSVLCHLCPDKKLTDSDKALTVYNYAIVLFNAEHTQFPVFILRI